MAPVPGLMLIALNAHNTQASCTDCDCNAPPEDDIGDNVPGCDGSTTSEQPREDSHRALP
jgi:hypothetical protein